MNQTHIFRLDPNKRFLHSPFAITLIGWMPHHIHYHRNSRINSLFVCISSNQEERSESLTNGILHSTMPNPLPHIGFVLPGTLKNTIRASYHDELFFQYPAEAVPYFEKLFGVESLREIEFYFSGIPETTIREIQHELEHCDEPGVPDLLDQLAIRLVTEILLRHRQEQTGENSLRLKLHSIVSELKQGKKLDAVLKQYGLSERTFYREWGKAFPMSPKEYLLKNRLEDACEMLTSTDLPIEEIGQKCGFASAVYFNQFFQKKTGMPPGKFRRKKRSLFPQ